MSATWAWTLIADHEHRMCQRADAALRAMDGVRVIGPTPDKKGGIVSFHVDRIHAHDVSQGLDHEGIAVRAGHHCTMPLHEFLGVTATTRASFYFYNTMDEVDQFVESLGKVQKKFAPSGRRRSGPEQEFLKESWDRELRVGVLSAASK